MDRSKYSDEIKNKLDYLMTRLHSSSREDLEIAQDLFAYALGTKDVALKGYAAYYCGNLYFMRKEEVQAVDHLTQALAWFTDAEEYRMMVETNNLLALIEEYEGNYASALDHFFQGLEVSQENLQMRMSFPILMNMSSLCEEAEDFENALTYRLQCMEVLMQVAPCAERDDYVLSGCSMLLRLYNKMDRMDDAKKEAEHLLQLSEQLHVQSCGLEVYVNLLEYAQKIGDVEKEELYLKKTEESLAKCEDVVEYFEECIALLKYYKNKKNYKEALRVLNWVKKDLDGSAYREMVLSILTEEVEIYQALGDETETERALKEFYAVACSLGKRRLLSMKSDLQLHVHLQQARMRNKVLRTAANTDALTGLWNRRKMNDVLDQLFEEADQKKESFALAMIDIDLFKQINDEYGHKKGDDCIQAVADVLLENAGRDQFVARYGGDEFFMIFCDLKDEEILDRFRAMAEKIKAKGKELNVSSLSISVGVANWVPRELNRVWDYSSAADEALYWVKNHGRSEIQIVHRAGEVDINDGRHGSFEQE